MAVTDRPWDGDSARFTIEQWHRSCLINHGGDETVKANFSLPVREPDGTLNRAGLATAAGRLDQVKGISAAQRAAAAHKLIELYALVGMTVPDHLRELAGRGASTDTSPGSNSANSTLERSYADCAVEIRSDSASGQFRIGGIGAPFHRRSQLLAGGSVGHFYEVLDPNTFEESRSQGWPSVCCRAEHDQRMLLGAVHSRTLALTITPKGVDYECILPPSPLGHNTYASVARSDYPGSSFVFQCTADSFSYEGGAALRTIQAARMVEIGPVSNPAYKDSSVALRSLARCMDADPAEVENYARSGELGRFFRRSDGGAPTKTMTGAEALAHARRSRPPQPSETKPAWLVAHEHRDAILSLWARRMAWDTRG